MKDHIKNAYKFLLPRVLEITNNLPAEHLGNLKELAATIETNCTIMLSAIASGKLPENVVLNDSTKELQKAHERIAQLENALSEAQTDVATMIETVREEKERAKNNDLTTVSAKLDQVIANDAKVETAIDTIEKHFLSIKESQKQIQDRLLMNK